MLVEVHDGHELERALQLKTRWWASTTATCAPLRWTSRPRCSCKEVPPERILVTESGILGPADVRAMRDAGIHSFLVGEAFMRADDPGLALAQLFA